VTKKKLAQTVSSLIVWLYGF